VSHNSAHTAGKRQQTTTRVLRSAAGSVWRAQHRFDHKVSECVVHQGAAGIDVAGRELGQECPERPAQEGDRRGRAPVLQGRTLSPGIRINNGWNNPRATRRACLEHQGLKQGLPGKLRRVGAENPGLLSTGRQTRLSAAPGCVPGRKTRLTELGSWRLPVSALH